MLRVVDLSTDEGDRRFRNIRVRLLNAVTTELAKVIAELQAEGKNLGVDAAGPGRRAWSRRSPTSPPTTSASSSGASSTPDVRISVARHVYWGTTGQRPPSPD